MTTSTDAKPIKKGANITGAERAELAAKIVKKYTDGASVRAIAEETGRSFGFVHRLLAEHEVPMRSRGARPAKPSR